MKLNYDVSPAEVSALSSNTGYPKILEEFLDSGNPAAKIEFDHRGDAMVARPAITMAARRNSYPVNIHIRNSTIYLVRRDQAV